MSVIAGALGSIIGYLGAEVAEVSIFERLLWPERFYNELTIPVALQLAFLMPMSGPLHAAALTTLDKFRDSGLYLGAQQGHMLGTAFYRNCGAKYYLRTGSHGPNDKAMECRNGFWGEVLRHVRTDHSRDATAPKNDAEAGLDGNGNPCHAKQCVRHLILERAPRDTRSRPDIACVTEEIVSAKSWLAVVCSELTSIVVAIVLATARPFKCAWLAVYLCVPLLLKVTSLLVRVRRTLLEEEDKTQCADKSGGASSEDLFEIDYRDAGFAVIQGPEALVKQFFRHYGHPVRDRRGGFRADRTREVLSVSLVYAFVLYFPAGLVSVLWMDLNVQYMWLGFQVYTVLAMHIVRIVGWHGCGRTEERIAKYLQSEQKVLLTCQNGEGVLATLEMTPVRSVTEGRQAVQEIIKKQIAARAQDHAALPRPIPIKKRKLRVSRPSRESRAQRVRHPSV